MAELIRTSVDAMLHTRIITGADERKQRALSVIGQFESGVPDLALEHDRYLEEAFGS